MKPVVMIHQPFDELFDHSLENYLLTFDDGYIEQYHYWPKFKTINTQKIYFIVPNWVGSTGFMTLYHIRELSLDPLTKIGGHSCAHRLLYNFKDYQEKIDYLLEDTQKMCDWFKKNLGKIPTDFCFPGNDAYYGIYQQIAREFGFTAFYGSERIPANKLSSFGL